MALTYTTLQTQIASFLNRDDLTAQIPTFILLAEAEMNRDIRHWKMEKRAEATFNERYEPLPADWIEAKRVSINGDRQLDLVSQAKMLEYREQTGNVAGKPRYYTLSAAQIELYPTPDEGYPGSMIYRSEIEALGDSVASNWVLAEAPDVYLYGSLKHSAPYLQEDPRLAVWESMYAKAVDTLNRRSNEAEFSGVGLSIR